MNQTSTKVDFTTLVLSISSAAYMSLGVSTQAGDESDQDSKHNLNKVNLEMARHNIDLLELLSEKTKGNLSFDEAKLIEHLLFETRMKFVEIQKLIKV